MKVYFSPCRLHFFPVASEERLQTNNTISYEPHDAWIKTNNGTKSSRNTYRIVRSSSSEISPNLSENPLFNLGEDDDDFDQRLKRRLGKRGRHWDHDSIN